MTETTLFFMSLAGTAAFVILCSWFAADFFDDGPGHEDDEDYE